MTLLWRKQVGDRVIERVIVLAAIVLLTTVAGIFFYLLIVSISGRRRLREPLTWKQFAIDLCFLAGGFGLLAYALFFVMIGQDNHDIAVPFAVAQAMKVVAIVLDASSVVIVIGAVAILLADRFLHPPERST